MTDCMLFQVLSLSCIIWEYPKPIYFNFGKHHWSKPYRNAPPIFAHTHTHPFPPYTSMCQKQYRESLALIQQDLQGCEACNAPSHWACMLYIPQWGSGIALPKGYSHIARFCTGVYLYIHILLPFMCACVERYIHTPILFFCAWIGGLALIWKHIPCSRYARARSWLISTPDNQTPICVNHSHTYARLLAPRHGEGRALCAIFKRKAILPYTRLPNLCRF